MIQLDYRDKRPLYEQLTEKIQWLILCGVLEADAVLPSVRQLALDLSINPNTIQRAYTELESRDIIYSVKGKGSFVSPNQATVRKEEIARLYQSIHATITQLKALGVDANAILEEVQRGVLQ